jgi:hypothetical protein
MNRSCAIVNYLIFIARFADVLNHQLKSRLLMPIANNAERFKHENNHRKIYRHMRRHWRAHIGRRSNPMV